MSRVVAISCRISKDKSGKIEGVKAQERWGRKYAAENWPGVPVEVFADGNASAMDPDGPRPEHDRFKEWLAAGRITYVWTVEQSRLERDEIEWFLMAARLEAAGVDKLHTNRDGIVDVRGVVAGIMAVVNASEVRKMKKRLHDTLGDKAALGEPPGSVVFGYEHGEMPDGTKTYHVIPEQADAIRWAADKVLAGWSFAHIADGLIARGLRGARGGEIRPHTVKGMVTNASIAGFRVYQEQIIGRGNWAPILDEDTWRAIKTKLNAPRIVKRVDGGEYPVTAAHKGNPVGRKYLTTGGLATCDVCDAPLIGSVKQLRNATQVRSVPYLMCHPKQGGKGCVGIMLERTEQFVVDSLLDELDKPEFLQAVAADQHAGRRAEIAAGLAAVDRQRDTLAAMWALPAGSPDALTVDEWQIARRGLAEQEQALQRALTEVPPPLINVDVAQIRASWSSMTLDERREILRLFIARVVIRRAVPGTKGFDSGRVSIEWQRR